MTANARGRSLKTTQLTGWIDPAARPEVHASSHQSLLVLRSTDRFVKEFGRHLKLGVRKLVMGFACNCRRIMFEKFDPAPLLTAMASPFAGSDATSASGLFETLSACHQYLPPRLDLRPRRAIGLPPTTTATSTTPASSTSHALLLWLHRVCGYAPNKVRLSAPMCRRAMVKSGDNDCKSTAPAMPAPSMRHGSKP